MSVVVKRVYEPAARGDGTRVLVDRSWPRGLSKERAAVHTWLRDIAPSDELRKLFHAGGGDWADFRKRYLKELAKPEAAQALAELYRLVSRHGRITLLFSSTNEKQNNAVVLRDLLSGMRKPPHGAGAERHPARNRQSKRLPRR